MDSNQDQQASDVLFNGIAVGAPLQPGINRREFVKAAAATGILISAGSNLLAAESKSEVPYRKLGRAGEKVSAIGVGGFHIGQPKDEQEGIRIIRTAIDSGINFMEYLLEPQFIGLMNRNKEKLIMMNRIGETILQGDQILNA